MDERTRHELHQRFDELLGADLAVALMSSLPPLGWGDIATKQHVDLRVGELERRMDLRFEARLLGAPGAQTRTLVFALLAANATFGALAFAAARLS